MIETVQSRCGYERREAHPSIVLPSCFELRDSARVAYQQSPILHAENTEYDTLVGKSLRVLITVMERTEAITKRHLWSEPKSPPMS